MTPGAATLVPQQTAQLTANVVDATGNALTGRSITWSSSPTAVATVTASGEVTAVAPGSATITATSEGKSGSATITVNQGGFVGTGGGVVTSADSAVRLVVPAGALPAGVALTITRKNNPQPPPTGTRAIRGTTYAFGPEGTQFAIPVTVIIKYDPDSLPPWVIPGDLVLQRWNGTQWSELTDLVVNPVGRTVTGRTPGFSDIGVGVDYKSIPVTLTPSPAKVNAIQRSVEFTAAVSGLDRPLTALLIEWTSTKSNGTLSDLSGRTTRYTALSPILPAGDIDGVGVVVSGQFELGGPFEVIGEAHTTVRAELDLVLQLQPTQTVVPYGGTAQFTAQAFDRFGNQKYDGKSLRYKWSATATAGTTTPITKGEEVTTIGVATYSALPPSQQSSVRPKLDKVTVTVIVLTENWLDAEGHNREYIPTEVGKAEALVHVIPQYKVSLVPESAALQAGGSATFQVKLEPAWAEDEQLFFEWRTTGTQGTLSVGQGDPVTQASVTYTAKSNPIGGTDFIDVNVMAGTLGRVGTVRGSVSVEARKTTVQGALFITPPVGLDAGRQCVEAYIVFPLVAEAKAYEMHAYGFNDLAFWKTEIKRTFTVPLPATRDCSIRGWGLTGSDGSQFRFYLSGFAGPASSIGSAIATFNSRFAGMKVDVTVRF